MMASCKNLEAAGKRYLSPKGVGRLKWRQGCVLPKLRAKKTTGFQHFFAKAVGKSVGKVASYADVVRGTHRNNSDVADAVRQPVVRVARR